LAVALIVASSAQAQDSTLLLREGAELTVQFDQNLSSANAADGDIFNISLADGFEIDGVKSPAATAAAARSPAPTSAVSWAAPASSMCASTISASATSA
jgi:hypothetical protein